MPLPVDEAELAVFSTDDFGLEADRSIRGDGRVCTWDALSFGIAAYPDDGVLTGESARDGGEVEGLAAIASDLLVREESDCRERGSAFAAPRVAVGSSRRLRGDSWLSTSCL
jgi:hypothetical protein